MKAKEYAQKLFELVENEKEFENYLEKCLKALCQDAENLIKLRRAKSDEAVAACINEVNTKWLAIVNQYNKLTNQKYEGWEETICPIIVKDGFKAAYVTLHPNRGWYFDISRHKKWIDEKNSDIRQREEHIKNIKFMPYSVTPYDQLKYEDLSKEIMACLASLGQFADIGIPCVSLIPLAHRITLLRYWQYKGSIDVNDATEMAKYEDPRKFFEERGFSL